MSEPAARWAIVVPVKRLAVAKTRLSDDPDVRASLALAMAADTVLAALSCERVATVVVVTDEGAAAEQLAKLGAAVVPDEPDAGLNPALEHGARATARITTPVGVAAVASDLPALRSHSLGVVLAEAEAHASGVVADAAGGGTTLYTATGLDNFTPRFGPNSRVEHRAVGAVDLTSAAAADLRRDVDTVGDLREAVALGLGPATTAALRRHALLG